MTPDRWREIEDLFHAARERGVEVFANRDPEIRREVEALLAQRSTGLLDQAASDLLSQTLQSCPSCGAREVLQQRI